jgi:hypothetical protein
MVQDPPKKPIQQSRNIVLSDPRRRWHLVEEQSHVEAYQAQVRVVWEQDGEVDTAAGEGQGLERMELDGRSRCPPLLGELEADEPL